MNIYKSITVNTLFFLLLSCGSTIKSLETFVDSNIKVDSQINNSYDLALSKIKNDSVGLYNSYNTNSSFLDSLYNELLDKKEVVLEFKDKPYYNLLLAKSLTDTTYLTNMYVKYLGVWKDSAPYVKHEGSWKIPTRIYKKVGTTWTRVK